MTDVIRYSRGKTKFDNCPDQREAADFDAFTAAVLDDRAMAKGQTYICAPMAKGFHNDPSKYPGEAPWRLKKLVQPRGFLPFDFDGFVNPETANKALERLKPFKGFAYTTASHEPEAPRCRVVLAQTRETSPEECVALGKAVQAMIEKELGAGQVKFDESVYRPEQPLFTPLHGANILRLDGQPVDVDAVLAQSGWKKPDAKSRNASRLEQVTTDDTLLKIMAQLGMVLSDQGGGKFNITCPFADEHTTDSGDSATVYYVAHTNGYAQAHFKCQHAHCVERSDVEFTAEVIKRFTQERGALPTLFPNDTPPQQEAVPKPKRKSISQVLANIQSPVWLMEGMLPRGFLIALLGHPNSGKTLIMLDLALRVALELPLGKHRVKRGRVVYIAAENPDEIKLRILLWCREHKIDPEALDGWFDLIVEPNLFTRQPALDDFVLDGEKPDLVITDTFTANFNVEDENKASDVMGCLNNLRQNLINPFGCAVVVLHHPPKGDDNLFNWRGSGAAAGTLDGIWAVKNFGGSVTLMQGKRRGPPFEDMHWKYHTKQINELKDNFNEVVSSVVALPTVTAGINLTEALICLAIKNGMYTVREIAANVKMGKTKIGTYLLEMKKRNREGGRLVGEKEGTLYLTPEGENLAQEAAMPSMQILLNMVGKTPSAEGDL